jgi:hypothetical protein
MTDTAEVLEKLNEIPGGNLYTLVIQSTPDHVPELHRLVGVGGALRMHGFVLIDVKRVPAKDGPA